MSLDYIHDADPEYNYEFFSNDYDHSCRYLNVSEYNDKFDINSLSLVNNNVRSFNRNFSTLGAAFYGDNLPSILCLTETRFSYNNLSEINGYKAFHTIRPSDTPAGGISLFVKDTFIRLNT